MFIAASSPPGQSIILVTIQVPKKVELSERNDLILFQSKLRQQLIRR